MPAFFEHRLDRSSGVNTVDSAVAITALFHFAFIDGMQRHAGDTVSYLTGDRVMVRTVAGNTCQVAAVRTHVNIIFTGGGGQVG